MLMYGKSATLKEIWHWGPVAAAEGLFATPIKVMYIEPAVKGMRARIQVYLDEEQDRLLEHLARVRRVSKSQLIRESIARYLEELIPPEEDPALGILGLAGKVGKKDLAEKHDDHLVSIHSQERRGDGQGLCGHRGLGRPGRGGRCPPPGGGPGLPEFT